MPTSPPTAGMSRGRAKTIIIVALAGGVLLVAVATALAFTVDRGQGGAPSVAVSREAAIGIAASGLGPEAVLRSAALTTLGATGLLAPPAGPDTLVWMVSFDGLSVPVCPPVPAPGASPPPCQSAAVAAVVVVHARTGHVLTTATTSR